MTVDVQTEDGLSLFNRNVTVDARSEVRLPTGIFTEQEGTFEVTASTGIGNNVTESIFIDARGTEGSIAIVEVDNEGVAVRRQWVNFTPTPVAPDC